MNAAMELMLWNFIANTIPDWVLMDWQMEKMDGIAATEQIIKQFPDAHICMVTSFEDEDLKAGSVQSGSD